MRVELALVGFGHVARTFVHLLGKRRDVLLRDFDLDCHIVGISTRRHGAVFDAGGVDTLAAATLVERGGSLAQLPGAGSPPADALDLIARLSQLSPAPRAVVETTTLDIGAGQPAICHVEAALASGCHVVTANKGPAAFAYHELRARAAERGVSFLFEGAVMDGIPVFNLFRETMPAVNVRSFRGVVNSTTNHILTALEDGDAFAPALARMQAEGIAEADPSLDVDGWDAAAKAAALANVLLGARVTPHDVRRDRICPETAARAQTARASGRRLRLVASATRGEPPIVELAELPANDLLAALRGTANAIVFETDLLGAVAVSQLDGGLMHTAYALLSDLVAIRRYVLA
jgi:homoserine dehydrogenase